MAGQKHGRRNRFAVVKHVLGILSSGRARSQGPEAEYDKFCTAIENWSRTAGALYNSGRVQEAYSALDNAKRSFKEARRILPSDPQAHVSLATTLLNAQKFDESIYLWRKARNQVENGAWGRDKGIISWIKGRIRYTRYGKVSVARDLVYAKGQGNMTAAVELMNKQLAIYPSSPILHHDRATAKVMLSELWGSNATAEAMSDFRTAQNLVHSAWRAGVRQRGRGGDLCASETTNGVVYDWPEWFSRGREAAGALVALEPVISAADLGTYGPAGTYHDHGGYVAQFKNVGLAGQDGVIVDEARCQIFIASSGPTFDLQYDLQFLEIWGDPPAPQGGPRFSWFDAHRNRLPNHGEIKEPQRIAKAASLVQFAEWSHFHYITEVLGRLWLLQQHGVFRDPEVVLIVRKDRRQEEGFLHPVLHMLVPDLLKQNRVSWWPSNFGQPNEPDVRLYVDRLYYADWRPPASFEEDGGHCSTPRSVLVQANKMLGQTLAAQSAVSKEASAEKSASKALVFILRRDEENMMAMRSKLARERELQRELTKIAEAVNPPLSFETFDGSPSSAATSALFGRARAVVGVHGGALANMLFCDAGVEVFEMGFATPFAGHYRHMAAALGLRITLLPLAADHRGMGSAHVRLADFDAAVATVRVRLLGNSSAATSKLTAEVGSSDEL